MSEQATETVQPPDPESRAFEGCSGTPIVLAGGGTWLLRDGGLLNALDGLRDDLYDKAVLSGNVPMMEVMEVAFELLLANYDLTAAEAFELLAGVEHQALADAVFQALFGPQKPRRTYTAWAGSAMLANGIDPASVPSSLVPHVLAQLEMGKRCIPRDKYIESAEAAPRLAGIRARAIPATAPATAPAPEPEAS
jgi:hypothetical protein